MGFMDKLLRTVEGKKVRALAGLVPEINGFEPEFEKLLLLSMMLPWGGTTAD